MQEGILFNRMKEETNACANTPGRAVADDRGPAAPDAAENVVEVFVVEVRGDQVRIGGAGRADQRHCAGCLQG